MLFLRQHIQHIVYVIKENRTCDQILGDLPVGNGDPTLTQFPSFVTPNFHAMATNFVDFDNFYDPGSASMEGGSGRPPLAPPISTRRARSSTTARAVPTTTPKVLPARCSDRGVFAAPPSSLART